ncbi:MAG: hypothetical protein IPM24_00800 [Bryobacterales bacterium]|nr:hypothetical protein [Bryobacterales bacterium]
MALSSERRNDLRKQCLWLYGVVVGLAIREAIVSVVPVFTTGDLDPAPSERYLLLFRLALFLLVSARFYLGAAIVFSAPVSDDREPNDAVDLLVGLMHFLFFFGWSTTLTLPLDERWAFSASPYFSLLCIVLLFDAVWWLLSWGKRFEKLNLWTVINTATFVLCALIHCGGVIAKQDLAAVEMTTFLPVAFVSLVDVSETTSGRDVIRSWFRRL